MARTIILVIAFIILCIGLWLQQQLIAYNTMNGPMNLDYSIPNSIVGLILIAVSLVAIYKSRQASKTGYPIVLVAVLFFIINNYVALTEKSRMDALLGWDEKMIGSSNYIPPHGYELLLFYIVYLTVFFTGLHWSGFLKHKMFH